MLEIFKYFLHLGLTGFGGPLMLIQHMRKHFVHDTKQMTSEEFDQAFTLIKAMPGPIAFQMASFLGNKFHKAMGAFLAGFALLLPSFLMMLMAGYFYSDVVKFSSVDIVLDGFLFSVSAVILISLKSLVSTNYKSLIFIPIVLINMYLAWVQIVPEPVLIIAFGILGLLLNQRFDRLQLFSVAFFFVDWQKVFELFKVCLVSGAVVFGTGFALIPVLKTNFVDMNHWLTIKEFNDGVILGQMTPGPISISGAFFGYQVSGFLGALLAIVGVFAMPFFHMVTWFPHAVKWLSKQKWINNFLLGATAAVVGSILTTIITMNAQSYNKIMFWTLFITTFVILALRPKTSIVFLVLAAGILNLLFSFAAVNAV
ncbi:chromate efflux transporter [bacterium]|nr:chromate efflux transporter [bacterium]